MVSISGRSSVASTVQRFFPVTFLQSVRIVCIIHRCILSACLHAMNSIDSSVFKRIDQERKDAILSFLEL